MHLVSNAKWIHYCKYNLQLILEGIMVVLACFVQYPSIYPSKSYNFKESKESKESIFLNEPDLKNLLFS